MTAININQLQRFALEKNFFWHGVLMLNENGGHSMSFFFLTYSFF